VNWFSVLRSGEVREEEAVGERRMWLMLACRAGGDNLKVKHKVSSLVKVRFKI
jgi:hypothetical protein